MAVSLSEVAFLQMGKGKDLVFLHGYLSSKEAFLGQIDYFSRFYRVTAFDFIGFGKSGELKAPFSVCDYADWTKNFLNSLGIITPHVIAHSFGCRVAIKMASSGREVFDKIILTGPAGVILKRGIVYKTKVKAYRLTRKFFPKFAEKKFGSKEYRSLSPIMRESYKKIVNEDLRNLAKRVKNEVLIVQGKKDKTTTDAEAREYLACLSRGQLKRIEGGHFAFARHTQTETERCNCVQRPLSVPQ